jgi:hypothetical protein
MFDIFIANTKGVNFVPLNTMNFTFGVFVLK